MLKECPNQIISEPTLQHELHAATRKCHMLLNQKITSRLPLCLPPNSTGPMTYASGMSVFGQIYFAFEEAWIGLLNDKESKICPRQRQMLKRLRTTNLERTKRLKDDLDLLKQRLSASQRAELAQIEKDASIFNSRIQQSIREKPHVTLAYTWCMYLALFNGGRWLLRQLQQPGCKFWLEEEQCDAGESAYNPIEALSFWAFDSSEENAEDIKLEFKANFNHAAELLTADERVEVIAESIKVFEICSDMVDHLDEFMQSKNIETAASLGVEQGSLAVFSGFVQPLSRIWQVVNSTAASYLYTKVPQPLREEIVATD